MASDVPLDYAVFQLSPRRSRCELFVSYDGTTEKLASGLVKPFVTHLKVAEEQVALAVKSIKLEVERYKNAETWFTKGTLERFVRFVSTPEVLEMVNTFDAEMSQLEAARRIYSQGAGDQQSNGSGGDGAGATAASDATKKELLRAIDVRLAAVKQDLTTASSRASAAGFNPETVSELQLFAERFGAHRLSEACSKFITLSQRRPDLFNHHQQPPWKPSSDKTLRSSCSSDMSLDDFSDDQPKPATCHQPTKVTFPLRRFSREPSPSPVDDVEERENHKDKEKEKDHVVGPTSSTTESDTPPTQSSQTPQLTRRLSVQERISLFESKQKENSPSTTTTTPSSTSAGKPELRRLSSDVNTSTSDKAVLRRWSGASDMSIDVSGERKEPDSNANTPTPTSSSRPVFPPRKDQGDSKITPSVSGRSSETSGGGGVRSRVASFGRAEDFGFENQSAPTQNPIKSQPLRTEEYRSVDESLSEEKNIEKNSGVSAIGTDGRSDGQKDEEEDDGLRDQQVPISNFKALKRSEASEFPTKPVTQTKGEKVEKVGRNDFESTMKQSEGFPVQMENFGLPRSKSQGQGLSSEQVRKPGGRREESGFGFTGFNAKGGVENQEAFPSTSMASVDQAQRVRQAKGNQGLNDELQMKADELEKLFAEHKLRVPGDRERETGMREKSNSARRTRPVETPKEQEGSSFNRKPPVEVEPPSGNNNNLEKLYSTPLMKTAEKQDFDVTPKHNIYSLGFLDDSRGKLYEKYMQKREAKLKEDWSSRRVEKEAKMKAMQDSLEKSRAEMKTKLAGSADKRNSVNGTRQRAEKLRSFNLRSATKRDQPVDSFISDEDEDQTEFLGKKLNETFLADSSSRSGQTKKAPSKQNTSSTTPRNPSSSIPRSTGKSANSVAGRRRFQSDNPLAQSVPNFSDLRKENTKPSSAGSKASARPQGRNHARKKSTADDSAFANDEKNPRRPQSLRKSSANSDDVEDTLFIPPKYVKEESDDMESKPSPRKGNNNGRSKAASRNGHDFDDDVVSFETEEMTADVAKEEEDDFDSTADVDNGKGRLSQESDKSANSGYDKSAPEVPTSMPSLFRAMGSLQDSPGESPGSWNSRIHNPFSFAHEISDIDASDSPLGSPASWNFHTIAQTEADAEAARMRKKWGAAQKPVVGIDSSHSSRRDVTKGLKRFLKFGRKNRASESLADWISATTSEGDDDTEDGRDPGYYRSSEDLRKSRMGFLHNHHSDDGFNDSDLFNDQVHALQSSIPTPPANFKLRDEHLSGSSLKAPKSFFSLSNFRSKGNDSKPR